MQEKEQDAQNGKAAIYIDKDKLKAYLEIIPPQGQGQPCTEELVKQMLLSNNIHFGINEEAIAEALQPGSWGKRILVAEGQAPVDGIPATIEFNFPLPKERLGFKIDDQGRANYYDLDLIHNVKKGQLLAVKIPPVEGVEGVNISGEKLAPRKGRDLPLPRGSNTVSDKEDRALYAAVDGHVSLLKGKVVVNQVFEVKGDVDFSSGNVNFVGNVLIYGKVNPGFKVTAGGDIEIKGYIEAGEVIAEGNVKVNGGITGGVRGLVKAGEDIYARFVENSRVEAGRDIYIREAIMQSNVKAGGSIKVSDKKAAIVGGIIQASQEVESKVLGSQLATQTIVEVGVNPHYREEYQNLLKIKTEKQRTVDILNHNLTVYQRKGMNLNELEENKRILLLKQLDEFKQVRQELEQIEKRLLFLEEEFEKIHTARVNVLETVYPGVRITVGQAMYIVNDPIKNSSFILEKGDVRVTSLR